MNPHGENPRYPAVKCPYSTCSMLISISPSETPQSAIREHCRVWHYRLPPHVRPWDGRLTPPSRPLT